MVVTVLVFGAVVSVTRLGDFLHFEQPFKATLKLPELLGNFCKGVKIINFCSEIIFGQLLQRFGDFYLVTLAVVVISLDQAASMLAFYSYNHSSNPDKIYDFYYPNIDWKEWN